MTYADRCKIFKRNHGIGRPLRVGHPPANAPSRRSYPGGAFNRLTADWQPPTATGDSEVRFDIQSLRDRSRDLERADGLMKRFLESIEKNVLESGVGFNLQNMATEMRQKKEMRAFLENRGTRRAWERWVKKHGRANGNEALMELPDFLANKKVEDAWHEWSKKKNCTENGEESLYQVTRLTLRSAARDGGYLIRKIVNPKVNDFGFALRMIEIDHLDINLNGWIGENRVVMGVEKNPFNKTVAYHLLKSHPGDMLFGASPGNRERVDARDIIHYYVKERITQCVGVPWAAPSMLRMHHLEQYELSELIASRKASNKGGHYISEAGDQYAGEKEEVTNADGTVTQTGTFDDSEPGMDAELPAGMKFEQYNPTHPTSQYPEAVRAFKMGIASGMGLSYATLVGDMREANFSSMRTGWLDERETYKKMQAHMVEFLMQDIFETWLTVQLTNQMVKLPMSKMDQFNKPSFRGRKWPWIDPQKDVTAKLMEINGGLTTREAAIAESDSVMDLEETFAQLKYETELAEENGLMFANPNSGGSALNDEAAIPAKEEAVAD